MRSLPLLFCLSTILCFASLPMGGCTKKQKSFGPIESKFEDKNEPSKDESPTLFTLASSGNGEAYWGRDDLPYYEIVRGYTCTLPPSGSAMNNTLGDPVTPGQVISSYSAAISLTKDASGGLLEGGFLGGDLCSKDPTKIVKGSELEISRNNPDYISYKSRIFSKRPPATGQWDTGLLPEIWCNSQDNQATGVASSIDVMINRMTETGVRSGNLSFSGFGSTSTPNSLFAYPDDLKTVSLFSLSLEISGLSALYSGPGFSLAIDLNSNIPLYRGELTTTVDQITYYRVLNCRISSPYP